MLRYCLFLVWLLPVLAGGATPTANGSTREAVASRSVNAVDAPEEIRRRPVVDLGQLRILELDESEQINLKRDWWKYMLMAVLVLTCLCLLTYLTRMLLQLLAVIGCVGAGVVGALGGADSLGAILAACLPGRLTAVVDPRLLGGAAGFLLGYALAAVLFSLLKKPACTVPKT